MLIADPVSDQMIDQAKLSHCYYKLVQRFAYLWVKNGMLDSQVNQKTFNPESCWLP